MRPDPDAASPGPRSNHAATATISWTAAMVLVLATALGVAATARGGDLNFSDPAGVAAPPASAIGFPSRAPDLDVLPGFRNPPPGYGEVAFFWWLGDPLTKERLTWELDRLTGMGVMGLQINYAHSDKGGRTYGLTYPSDPPLFSDAWWKLVGWFIGAARERGMAVSLSDYTLGVGQGWRVDELLREHPEMTGAVLRPETREFDGGKPCSWALPEGVVAVTAYRVEKGKVVAASATDLRPHLKGGALEWPVPAGHWSVVAVRAERVVPSLDPTHPQSGPEYARRFFGQFEEHNPGTAGKGLNFFFSDELDFRVRGELWSSRFADEFRKRKGYDLVPELPALFTDIGPRTPKVRLDYRDVMVALSEEGFFRPVFDWHQERGMIFGCDHGGRGRDVTEFGDYFRAQRWNQGPGCDQPVLARDLIKNKVASSISHLYERPRVWLEGYHSSGWSTSSADIADATFANFVTGQNLLTFHGLYYSTHGGWWEWAPPDNHFRMPYYADLKGFMTCVQRLSYLLSQGHHRCDVAIVYPVAPMEAGLDGEAAVLAAFNAGQSLYAKGIDFDFIDFESLARARVAKQQLQVSGESYRVLILPAMKAVRQSTMEKAVEFYRGGGMVVSLGALPEASDHAGRDDPELDAMVKLVFGVSRPKETVNAPRDVFVSDRPIVHRHASGGMGLVAVDVLPVVAEMTRRFPRDFAPAGQGLAPSVMHRKIGPRDVYAVYNGKKDMECSFRATGQVELWNPWTGRSTPLAVVRKTSDSTVLRLPLGEKEIQLIVFTPGKPTVAARGQTPPAARRIALKGDWDFALEPTLDNRFGDFRWPPSPSLIGAEARRFRYAAEPKADVAWYDPKLDDAKWPEVTASFGPKFWKLGPLPANGDATELETRLAALTELDGAQPVEFSWQWGIENDPGHQGWHGLKELVHDEFLALGTLRPDGTGSSYAAEKEGTRYYLWTSVPSSTSRDARTRSGGLKPAAVWWRGRKLKSADELVHLEPASNPLLLRYDQPGRGYFVVDADVRRADVSPAKPGSLAMRWHDDPSILPFDPSPQVAKPAGWYRFRSAPGLRGLKVTARGKLSAWVDGKAASVAEVAHQGDGVTVHRVDVPEPARGPATVALRIEYERGHAGGAAIPEPIAEECGPGAMAAGDWSEIDGLRSYSGGAWYRKAFKLTPEEAGKRVELDLGRVVASAEVRVNGKPAGVVVAPPFVVDLSGLVEPGENRLEVRVRNTLANHYTTIPTRYRGALTSGLLGPVGVVVSEAKR